MGSFGVETLDPPELELPPRVPWDQFKASWEWARGEHVTVLGPTGSGKTWLITAIVDKHPDVACLALKPNDQTLYGRLPAPRWDYVSHWPPPTVRRDRPNWVVVKPKRRDMAQTIAHQTRVVRHMFQRIYQGPPHSSEEEQGGWTIVIPDLSIILDDLKGSRPDRALGLQDPDEQLAMLYKHGRGIRVSLVVDAQTTAWLQRLSLDQPSHFFFFKPRDRDRAKRIAEIGNADPRRVSAALDSLEAKAHEVLYVDANSGDMLITAAD